MSDEIHPQAMGILNRGGIAYRQTIHWTTSHGRISVTSDYCDNKQQAVEQAWLLAKKFGWTEPKWWQFWRWGDSRLPIQHERSQGG